MNVLKWWKKDECRSSLCGIGPKEEEFLVYNVESEIHRRQNRPSA
jgi:hypothetical protein